MDAVLADAAAVPYLNGAVNSSREEASSGDSQSCYTALMSQQGLCTDHVVHAPHLNINTAFSLYTLLVTTA